MQALSQKIMLGGSFEGNVDLSYGAIQPTIVQELLMSIFLWCVQAQIYEG